MNKTNIIIWEDEDYLIAEWADRSPDDEDRYKEDAIIIEVEVDLLAFDTYELAEKKLMACMCMKYDEWVSEREA